MKALVGEKVELRPWQQIPEQMEALGLTIDDVLAKAWYVSATSTSSRVPSGQAESQHITGGAEAINDTLRHVWYIAPLTYLYYVPGLRQLQDRIYQRIADNRYKLPGSTAVCNLDDKPRTTLRKAQDVADHGQTL